MEGTAFHGEGGVDDALKAGSPIGPVADETQLKQDEGYIDIGRKEAARLVFGGERLIRENPGFYLQPALFTDTTNQMRISLTGPFSRGSRIC